jgi:hypothetical protein
MYLGKEIQVTDNVRTLPLRELDQRESDGMVVTLLWHEPTNGLMVCVSDERTGSYFELEARADNALEVFHHPYAHAA